MAFLESPHSVLQTAVKAAGSQSALARICGVTQASVWAWLQREKALPAEHVLNVERETGVSRHLLRPDIYPLEVAADHLTVMSTSGEQVDFDRAAEMKRAVA